jgi:hypothetical protein
MKSRTSSEDSVGELEADITGGIVTGFPEVCAAFEDLRSDFLTLVSELDASEWQQPSRCHLWSVHDLVRHVRDGSKHHVALLHGQPPEFRPDDPFDNRNIPLRWLAGSAGEQPNDTVRDLEQTTAAELDALRARAARGGDETYVGPYGRAHWTVLTTHVFWDSWLHVRDITRPLERPERSTLHQDSVAALYGLLVASIPAAAFGDALDTAVRLNTASGSVDAHVQARHVKLERTRPGEPADLEGELGAVVDALTGRGPAVETVLAGDPTRREPLTRLRTFMTPSE